ncbi:MAG: uracil-DNA glycosylase [Chlamydiae bacterium]|nr:uracil-DNA glycosylase [Chlamydiota bacterium]MBI3265424.1 uracil-DNA glycosylase [Chlamydiota bacterium]
MQFDLFDQAQNTVLAANSYEEFRKKFLEVGCTQCGLHEGRTHLVIDRGNPQTEILVIGEAPGEQEDLQGKAFVGRAGQLLDKIMASINLDTNKDMIIINVVKCRPPNNRAPVEAEAKTCRPYLNLQIELVKPKIILLLGATALKHMIPEKKNFSMEQEAGNFFIHPNYPGIQFMVLYHPAYLLYDPRKKESMWKHVKKLRDFLGLQKGKESKTFEPLNF